MSDNIRPADFDINDVISFLQGTCKTLNEALVALYEVDGDENILTSEDHAVMDNEIFLCDTCNWWFDISEQSEDGEKCNDCFDTENGGDDA